MFQFCASFEQTCPKPEHDPRLWIHRDAETVSVNQQRARYNVPLPILLQKTQHVSISANNVCVQIYIIAPLMFY